MTSFYKVLEVERSASAAEIRRAYRRLALEHHPDKGGDPEKFKEITRAFKVLSDPEKRPLYDMHGEEGLEGCVGRSSRRRPKTRDVIQPLKVTLEQLYTGHVKKMAITRKVIDKTQGVQECPACEGRGVTVEVIQLGPLVQQVPSQCQSCAGSGRSFRTKSEREVVEVHIQKGSPDGHKVQVREMADERPGADTGDVVFVLKQQEHPDFKRKGADLFVERKISLVEALCGFSIELTHLDGRRLLIKTAPGDIVRPMARGFDPVAEEESKTEWEVMENCDCPGIDSVARADTTDVDELKRACEAQLKGKGIGAFVIHSGRAYFKQCTREEALAAQKTKRGSTMFVVSDPEVNRSFRMMKAVKDEGMPTLKNPFVRGNLFLNLTIEFPESLTPEVQKQIQGLLPPPLHTSQWGEDDETVEVHTVTDADPVRSFQSNRGNMTGGAEAYDEEERDERGFSGAQCHQQ